MNWIRIEWDGNEDLVNLDDVVSARHFSDGSLILWFSSGRSAEFKATRGQEHLDKLWQALKNIAMIDKTPISTTAK